MNESTISPAPEITPAARPAGPGVRQLGIVVAILGVGVLLTALTSDVSKVSEPGVKLVDDKVFLPEKAGDWTGGEMTGLTEAERTILPPDTEGSRRLYTDSVSNQVFCSVVLAGRDVTSIHRPELCLRGQGWSWGGLSIENISVPGGLQVARLDAHRPMTLKDGQSVETESIFVYWFVGKERTTPHHWQRIMWTTMDRVLHNRNHRWAYFLVYAPVATTRADTMRLVDRFIKDLYPVLQAN